MKTTKNKKKMHDNPIRYLNYQIRKLEAKKNPDGAETFAPKLGQFNKINELREKKRQLVAEKKANK